MSRALLRAGFYALTLIPPLALSAALAFQPWVEARWAFMDVIAAVGITGEARLYYGFVSNLGVLYLAAAAAITLFAAACRLAEGERSGLAFLISAGVVSGWLALDDMFMLHEAVIPMTGAPQEAGVALAGLLALGHGLVHRRAIAAGEWPLMAIAYAGLALSAALDLVVHSVQGPVVVLEDAAKFVGLASWAAFHADAALRAVTFRSAPTAAARVAPA